MARQVKKGFLFDPNFCIGCKACELACQVYHRQESGINWRKVDTMEANVMGKNKDLYLSTSCNHCEEPECVRVCPTYAFTKREDGIVVLDREKCISCGACEEACTYGAITRAGEDKLAQKCNMCAEKQDAGEIPECVRACPMETLRIVDIRVADAAGMVKTAPGFKPNFMKPSIRFYPNFSEEHYVKLL